MGSTNEKHITKHAPFLTGFSAVGGFAFGMWQMSFWAGLFGFIVFASVFMITEALEGK